MTHICICINIVAGVLLVNSYFLPYAVWDWSPYRMAHWYTIEGSYMSGPAVFLYESAYSVGLGIALVAATVALLAGRRRLAHGLLLVYGALWLAATVAYLIQFFRLPAIEHPNLWIVIAAVAIPTLIVAWILLLKSSASTLKFNFIALVLGCACVLWNIVTITFCLVEDKMLLNYGAMVSAAGATAITLGALLGVAVGRVGWGRVLDAPALWTHRGNVKAYLINSLASLSDFLM